MAGKIAKVPQVMQMEALECGAACLAMVLAYYGRWVPLEQMRTDCGISRDGSKASNILKAARNYGLAAKGMTFSPDGLRNNGTFPCILFWNFNHFVVLCGFKGNNALINDPACGQVKIPLDQFEESFTGIALMFEPTDSFQKGGTKPDPMKFSISRLKGLEASIASVMLTAAIASIVSVFSISLGKVFIDRILTGDNPSWLMPLLAVMLALALISGVASILNSIHLMRIQGKIAVVSSSRFMRHLLHLPIEFYSQRLVGDLQQRQSTNETIAFTLVQQLAPVLVNTIMLVLYLIVMLDYSVLLTAVGILTVVANSLLAHYISKKRINISRLATMNRGKLYATTVGGIEMIETIKAAGAEDDYFCRWAGCQALVNEASVGATRLNEHLGMLPQLVTRIANIAVLVLGIWLIVESEFTPGMLLAFTGFLGSFMTPVSQIINLGQTVQEMQVQMERVEDVMRYPVDVPEGPDGEESTSPSPSDGQRDPQLPIAPDTPPKEEETDLLDFFGREKLSGRVDLENVTFGYSPLEQPLIEGFELHLEPGQWVALVGESGCGKSTIAKLVSGLYEPWAGEVRFDGIPLREVPRTILRGSLAVVDQDIVTFDDTVSNNIKLWDRSIEDFEVILACRDADIHETILEREGGYSSRILPGGRNFSGGQLQRLEIARVLAQDPTVIILDEATNALDAQTEAEVIKRIRDRGITCIVVAHRLSTIRDCDEIIVLDDGEVVERGTHSELLEKGGAYAELVRND